MNSPTRTASIDDLPPEMICELFKHLQPKHLVACSMVNKCWHSIYAGYRLHRLVVVDLEARPLGSWYHSDQEIEDLQLCDSKLFGRLIERPLLSNLKYLTLYDNARGDRFEIDLNELNRFRQLLHLEIYLTNLDEETVVHWNFPKLKVLAFRCYVPLSIDCPELRVLNYSEGQDENLLNVKHPETIRKLETDMFGAKLDPFKCVECLITREFKAISKATLLSLPRLNELHYNRRPFRSSYNAVGTFERFQRTLRAFVNDVEELRGSDFRFRFAGFQLTKRQTLEEIDFGMEVLRDYAGEYYEWMVNEYVYAKNHHLIDPDAILDFVRELCYSDLMNVTEIPAHFFQQFRSLEVVKAYHVEDPAHFLWFLKSLRSLEFLTLSGTRLDQKFFDQLPAVLPSLVILDWIEHEELQLNFDFISQLPCLTWFQAHVDFFVSPELLASFVRIPARLELDLRFHFCFKERRCRIEKEKGSKLWKVSDEFTRIRSTKSENQEEILNFLEQL